MNNLTVADVKKVLAEKSVSGFNALVAHVYDSNIEKATSDINKYLDSSCSSIAWYISDVSDKNLKRFFDETQDDLGDFLDGFMDIDFLKALDMQEFEITYLFLYGLDPDCLPKQDSKNADDKGLILTNKKRIILGWFDNIINNVVSTAYGI